MTNKSRVPQPDLFDTFFPPDGNFLFGLSLTFLGKAQLMADWIVLLTSSTQICSAQLSVTFQTLLSEVTAFDHATHDKLVSQVLCHKQNLGRTV